MAETRIDNSSVTNLTGIVQDAVISAEVLDSPNQVNDNEWLNDRWNDQLGYYKNHDLLQALIDAKARWTIGKGFLADPQTTILLDTIRGWGNDTFNTILESMARTMEIGGDSFAEIIRDKKENLINIKPMNPGEIKIISDKKGIIKRYEKIQKGKRKITFEPEEVFHLSRNRVADEIHGNSMINERVEQVLLSQVEAMEDMRTLMHRHVKPMRIWYVDEDDPTKISNFKSKVDNANNKTENMVVPKGTVETEIVAVPSNATLSPLPWMEYLDQRLHQGTGVPPIIIGGSKGFTEAAEKMLYLAFQQTVEEHQLYIEEQMLAQLNMVIELVFPASLENELLSDQKKDVESGASQPNESVAARGV